MDIIQQIVEEMVVEYGKAEKKFGKSHDLTDLLISTRQIGMEAVRKMVAASLESLDQNIRDSEERIAQWYALRKEAKTLVTSLGEVCYKRTLYRAKEDSQVHSYLLDSILGIEAHQKLTDDAVASMLEEVAVSSYEKSGKDSCMDTELSRETVKQYIHALQFPQDNYNGPKKVVDYLYIDADEDHVSLQFKEHKGDLKRQGNYKNNTSIQKVIYVYEGKENIGSEKSPRRKLKNPHYFCGAYSGTEANEELWKQVYDYIEHHYEVNRIKKIYLNADGGSWITAGALHLGEHTYVLDRFHLEKYLIKLTSGLSGREKTACEGLREFIRTDDKKSFNELITGILEETAEVSKPRIQDARKYILNNWDAARIRLEKNAVILGCSAEGHVSHALSSRMSSRPMGWSIIGADKMAHLRAYVLNNGNLLQLVQMQKQLQKPHTVEERILTSKQVITSERKRKQDKYFDMWYSNVGDVIRQKRFYKGICGAYAI